MRQIDSKNERDNYKMNSNSQNYYFFERDK